MKIYVFGNQFLKEDSLPLKILPGLKKKFPKIDFAVVDPNENFPRERERNLLILDTVLGIEKPRLFGLGDLQEIKKSPNSPHDYDLGMHLLLLKKIRKIDSVKIVGIPSNKVDISKIQDLIAGLIPTSTLP